MPRNPVRQAAAFKPPPRAIDFHHKRHRALQPVLMKELDQAHLGTGAIAPAAHLDVVHQQAHEPDATPAQPLHARGCLAQKRVAQALFAKEIACGIARLDGTIGVHEKDVPRRELK